MASWIAASKWLFNFPALKKGDREEKDKYWDEREELNVDLSWLQNMLKQDILCGGRQSAELLQFLSSPPDGRTYDCEQNFSTRYTTTDCIAFNRWMFTSFVNKMNHQTITYIC